MQDWMDEFRNDRMEDYAHSNPCMESSSDCDGLTVARKSGQTLMGRVTKILRKPTNG